MKGVCKFCGETKHLHFGGCWDCVEAESIIDEGYDMRNNGPDGSKLPATNGTQKLKMLISIGWTKISSLQKNEIEP